MKEGNMSKYLWMAVAGVITAASPAKSESFWHGSIGRSEVVMELSCNPLSDRKNKTEKCGWSRYYYTSTLQDIVLREGNISSSGTITLKGVQDKKGELLRLNATDGDALSGWWQKGSRKLPVVLRRISAAEAKSIRSDKLVFRRLGTKKVDRKKLTKKLWKNKN
jgi:hypothetical protein